MSRCASACRTACSCSRRSTAEGLESAEELESLLPVFGLAQLDQLHVLHVAVHAADRDVQQPRQAVEEAQAHEVELDEAHHGREEEVQQVRAAPLLEGLARGERGV